MEQTSAESTEQGRGSIAGFRLVRTVRRTHDRDVWIAVDPVAPDQGLELHRALPGEEQTLADELDALHAVEHAHLVPIVDLAVDAGPVLVRPALPLDLAAWLERRASIALGEAVTVLAPVAACLAALHASGVAVHGFGLQDIRIDIDGAPLLLAVGARRETERPTQAWLETSEGVQADMAAFQATAEAVLVAAGASVPSAVEHACRTRSAAEAEAALLALTSALPLRLSGEAVEVEVAARPRRRMRAERGVLGRVHAWIGAVIDRRLPVDAGGVLHRFSTMVLARPPMRTLARQVRPRFWALGGAAAVAATLAFGLLVAEPDAAASQRAPTETSRGGAEAATPGATSANGSTSDPTSDEGGESAGGSRPVPSDHGVSETEHARREADPAASAADPVSAATAVLAEREACLDTSDAACLVALHDPESPLLTAPDPWRMPSDGSLELVEQLGDAWLFDVHSETAPASVLVTSTEAGVTVRDAWPR